MTINVSVCSADEINVFADWTSRYSVVLIIALRYHNKDDSLAMLIYNRISNTRKENRFIGYDD